MELSFAAERTLGKLTKWLRILGFDTIFESGPSTDRFFQAMELERILLTRTDRIRRRFAERTLIFVESNDPFEQLRQVVTATGITRADVRPFSRCLQCNLPIAEVDKGSVYGLVPDYVWETQNVFHRCRQCERIYWAGSHPQRSMERIQAMFAGKASKSYIS